ncbi:hypothetical protein CJ030_MR2G028510 [Morella rubra]|uniref:3-oxo-5-alpha-steroid 4-dehydrogenase C-terminal domain-containing protein n=1 Tax=Morella rubra TaxID=262757 RepID=A0A6A1WH00_9ROSI|nr:hypothetical protein CJ030_MR2G028510 [Morella rubra]
MRRGLLRPLAPLSAPHLHPSLPLCPYKDVVPFPNPSQPGPTSPFTSNPRWVFATSLPPPAEWVEPFNDVSDIVATRQNLDPSPWVSQILNLLDGSPAMEANLGVYCHKFLIKLSPNFVSFILQSNKLREDPAIALRFFYWAGKQKSYAHSIECYVSLIAVLSLRGDVERILCVLREFKEMGFVMTVSAANSLIKSLGSVGIVDELLWVWRRMKENGIDPGVYTYNFLVNGLVNSMFIESAERVLEAMESGRTGPDVVTYNTMIKGYCKAGKTKKAMEKIKDMELRNVEPDKITYMTLMQACYSDGDFNACLGLYHEMEEKGLEIPDHAYSLVIGALGKDGKCAEGYAVFERMTQKGYKGNVAIYTALIDSYGKSGNMEWAIWLFQRMKNEGFEPDDVTYGVIVNGLCKGGRLEEAMEYLGFCKGNGVVLSGGKIDEALGLFKRMEEEGCDETVYTYTILTQSGLFNEHRNEEALKMWDMMINRGITPTAASFRALSIGLCLSGKIARACKILDELAPMGVIPETAFEDMINVLCKAGRIKEACKLADGIVDRGREGSLRDNVEQEDEYVIPHGDWFEIVSSPHYLAEIVTLYVSSLLSVSRHPPSAPCVIYAGLVVASGGADLTIWLLFAFVVANLAFAAAETHRWYIRKFDNYPRNRLAIIPFLQ